MAVNSNYTLHFCTRFHRLWDSLTELDELHKTVQKPVDVVQNWSVQMYYTPTSRGAALPSYFRR